MSGFFPRPPGLAVFLNAGDPPFDVLDDIADMLDEQEVDVLELGVPFPDSISDGPVIRRSADRALAAGTGLEDTLAFAARSRGRHRRLRVVVLADWAHTVRPRSTAQVVTAVAGSGAAGILLHGAPPRVRPEFYDLAGAAGLPVVTTCYASSPPAAVAEAGAHASAYVYLVAHYGRSGAGPAPDPAALRAPVHALRALTGVPVAAGFGVRTAADVERVHAAGADAAVIGSAVVARAEASMASGGDITADLADLVTALRPPRPVPVARPR
ncbi:tryptophan synthase subunit alpha [Streptomyces qinzhouensis]|uniref:tryptophan synthase n=1 Tax=Streptomyces qinzhouensis TaxID=2599401 RepID=A0A5B8J548_9ACTN|nr:tryptophan synthase subunit alpha [Streptomyces qinzhouensis]QDY75221.1 tryptophan synthase subunit alpha [Streptomyces qinzhouensis]QDY80577.1 tryptophan synthase subunit alpha [Streptomyces qinzhouensis]